MIPDGTTVDLGALVSKIIALEKEVAALKAVEPPSAVVTEFNNILIKGKAAPPILDISDSFGKKFTITNEIGHAVIVLSETPAQGLTGSLRVKNAKNEGLVTINYDGTIRLHKVATKSWQDINTIKPYVIYVIDEVGNPFYLKVNGGFLRRLFASSN